MATLEKIRQRSGLLIIVIGVAMLAFILTDLLGSGNSILMGDAANVGKVNSLKISIDEFSKRLAEKTENYKNQSQDFALERASTKQLADATWDDLLREIIMDAEYEKLGIVATKAEVFKEITNNPNISGAQAFRDQITGDFNAAMLTQYLANMRDEAASGDENARDFLRQWIDFENAVKSQILTTKYNTAIQKGLYTPKALAMEDARRKEQNVSVQFVYLPYTEVEDSEVTVSEADIKAYYKANKEKYKNDEETRDIEFVEFTILPSEQDIEDVTNDVLGLIEDKFQMNAVTNEMDTIEGFRTTDNDSLFVEMNSDIPFQNTYYKLDEFPAGLDTILWDAAEGTLHGPYEDAGFMNVAKVNKVISMPDSVKASHILISHQGAERAAETITRDFRQAQQLADSLYKIILDDPAKFETFNMEFSDDQVSKMQGGDLNWFKPGMMAQEFNDYCFQNSKGDIGFVLTDFGYHIIRIDEQGGANKAVRLATLSRRIFPSENTIKSVNRDAANFAANVHKMGKTFTEVAEEMGYFPRPVTDLNIFDENIIGLGNSRNIVRWAFDEKTMVGDLNIFDVNNQTVAVVNLSQVSPKGYSPVELVRDEIELKVKVEKKGEILKGRLRDGMKAATDVASLANNMGQTLRVNSAAFSNINFPGAGNEPKVTGVMHGLALGVMSEPIAGEMGVYVLYVTSIDPFEDRLIYDDEKNTMTTSVRNSVPGQIFLALKKNAKITDRRHIFY
jgi:peptidyl-prolyl cis-trans isomerase D